MELVHQLSHSLESHRLHLRSTAFHRLTCAPSPPPKKKICSSPSHPYLWCDLIGKSRFCICNQVKKNGRTGLGWAGTLVTCVLIEGHVPHEAEFAGMQPQSRISKHCRSHQGLGEKHGTVSPLELPEATNLANTLLLASRNVRISVYFKPPRWWYFVMAILEN